jgi:hypothetical protein
VPARRRLGRGVGTAFDRALEEPHLARDLADASPVGKPTVGGRLVERGCGVGVVDVG